MKKLIIYVILCFQFTILYSQAPELIETDKGTVIIDEENCISTVMRISTPYINPDCDPELNPSFKAIIRFRNCLESMFGNLCELHKINIYTNGELMSSNLIPEDSDAVNEEFYPEHYLPFINEGDTEICFKIEVYESCPILGLSVIYSEEKCFPVVKEGDVFEKSRISGPVSTEILDCITDPKLIVCCKDPEVNITTNLTVISSSSQTETFDITFGNFSIGGDAFEVEFPLGYDETTAISIELIENQSITRSLTIPREDGVCNSAAVNLNYAEKWIDRYEIQECGIDPVVTSHYIGKVLLSVTLTKCVLYECNIDKPDLVFNQKVNSFLGRSMCTGSINATIPEDYEGELDFLWEGPFGFYSTEQNIENVPFGNYILTVTDDCCNEYSYEYYICDEIEYGSWIQHNDPLMFCRTLQCGSEDCHTDNSEECVEPDDIIEVFENESCVKYYYYKNEVLGSVSLESNTEVIYNEVDQLCTHLIYCDGSNTPIETNTQSPSFGSWSYNSINEECSRAVICFDEEHIETIKADVTESYNNFTGLCEYEIYCDGFLQSQPQSFPIFQGAWEWNEMDGCEREVQCTVGGDVYVAEGTESFYNWQWNAADKLCEASVFCDFISVFGETHTESAQSVGTWSYNSAWPLEQQCSRQILCSGNFVTEYTAPNFPSGPSCSCDSGATVSSHYIYCEDIYIDWSGCPLPSECFEDKDDDSSTRSIIKENLIFCVPNPFNEIVTINGLGDDFQRYSLTIFNVEGERVYTNQRLNGPRLELGFLNNGLYFINIMKENNTIYQGKIIKTK